MPLKKKDRKTDKDRNFIILLYPDNKEHQLLILQMQRYHYDTVGILHDRDIYDDDIFDKESGDLLHKKGELKKIHYHFFIKFKNPRYISGVAEDLGVEENLIRFADEYKKKNYGNSALRNARYFLHWDYPNKYQYNETDLLGNLASSLIEKLIDKPKSLQFDDIYEFIMNFNGKVTVNDVYLFCRSMGYVSCYLRYNAVIEKHIFFHNERYFTDSRGVR